jgi:hypothetical protein
LEQTASSTGVLVRGMSRTTRANLILLAIAVAFGLVALYLIGITPA